MLHVASHLQVNTRHMATISGRNVTRGGQAPIIRHFVGDVKPWVQNLAACQNSLSAAAKAGAAAAAAPVVAHTPAPVEVTADQRRSS